MTGVEGESIWPPHVRCPRPERSSSTRAAMIVRSGSPGTTTPTSSCSLWRENVCTGSFRLTVDEVPELIYAALRSGLDTAYTLSRVRDSIPKGLLTDHEPSSSRTCMARRTTRESHDSTDSIATPSRNLRNRLETPIRSRAWTRSATRTHPAPGSGRRSWPAGSAQAGGVRRGARAGGARPARAEHPADGAAQRRQDRAAQRDPSGRRSRRGWGTGKLEARPDQGPASSAVV